MNMNPKLVIVIMAALLVHGCSKKTEDQRAEEALSNAVVKAFSAPGDAKEAKWPEPPKDAPTGRLGLKAEDLAKVWGPPEGDAEPEQLAEVAKRYAHAGYAIVAHFRDGKACMLDVRRPGSDLTEPELISLLESVTGKGGWPGEGFRRVRSDGACVLQIVGFNSHASIYTRGFWEAQQKANEAAERQRGKSL